MAISADAISSFFFTLVLGVVGFLLSRLFKTFDENIQEIQAADKILSGEHAAFRLEVALIKQRIEAIEAEIRSFRKPLT